MSVDKIWTKLKFKNIEHTYSTRTLQMYFIIQYIIILQTLIWLFLLCIIFKNFFKKYLCHYARKFWWVHYWKINISKFFLNKCTLQFRLGPHYSRIRSHILINLCKSDFVYICLSDYHSLIPPEIAIFSLKTLERWQKRKFVSK